MEDSYESGPLRREAISTVAVCRLLSLKQAFFPHKGALRASN